MLENIISENNFSKLIPRNKAPDMWYEAFDDILPRFDIVSQKRIIAFIAQCGHESADFTRLEENLNYSASGLRATWPSRFKTINIANKYARKPIMIANYVYANRMGNGDEESGDGWRYRGRGIIQLTGKSNYTKCSKDLYGSMVLVEVPDLVSQVYDAIMAAGWFWKTNNLNRICDTGDMTLLTRRINGGNHGLTDRINRYNMGMELSNET